MINQLIEKLEELQETYNNYPTFSEYAKHKLEGSVETIAVAIWEAKQLQEKVRCGNCKYWKKVSDIESCIGDCNLTELAPRYWIGQKTSATYYSYYCKFWEEKE